MARVSQQPIPKPFAEVFAKAGIAIKQYQSAADFEQDLLAFLSRNHVVHLAMCRDNTPRSTPLEYRLDGLALCILSAGGEKFDFLKHNNAVSFSIAEPYDSDLDYFGYKGLQGWGHAEVLSCRHDAEAFAEAFAKMRVERILQQLGVQSLLPEMHYRIIRIVPERIKYGNPREGIFRVTWARDEEGD